MAPTITHGGGGRGGHARLLKHCASYQRGGVLRRKVGTYGISVRLCVTGDGVHETQRVQLVGRSNMDCDDHKVSAERCLFLILLNEDGLEENRRKSGKERLMGAWDFKGEEGGDEGGCCTMASARVRKDVQRQQLFWSKNRAGATQRSCVYVGFFG